MGIFVQPVQGDPEYATKSQVRQWCRNNKKNAEHTYNYELACAVDSQSQALEFIQKN